MIEQKKTVLVIEDSVPQREGLIETLTQYGFNSEGGETIARSLELLQKYKDEAAVIIIDMDLSEFPDYIEHTVKEGAPITGISVAGGLLKEHLDQRPQVIILSAFVYRTEYYQQSIEAGASAYLVKGVEKDRKRLLPLIQALTLKYAFQPSSANDAEVARLAEGHANSFELLSYFCSNKLARELDICLSKAAYILLFRTKNGVTQEPAGTEKFVAIYSDVTDIPGSKEFDYARLHQRIFDQLPRDAVYTLDPDDFPGDAVERLQGFNFVQLVNTSDAEIAIGIASPFPVKDELNQYPFSTRSLAEALAEKVSPVLDTFVEKLIFRWHEKQSVKLERVKTFASLSSSILRELNASLPDTELKTIEQATKHLDQLSNFTQELFEYNRALSLLLENNQRGARSPQFAMTRISELVHEIKTEYDRKGYCGDVSFTVEDDCLVTADRLYFSLALIELIKWAIERKQESEKQAIQIRCTHQGNWIEIYFREQSRQMSKRMRESYLFEPISPLHLAQQIIEVACQGQLVDVTDELKTAIGHLFKIRLLRT